MLKKEMDVREGGPLVFRKIKFTKRRIPVDQQQTQ